MVCRICNQPVIRSAGMQVTMAITPQFVQQVFAEKPHVHRAYIENVPHAMDAEMFWTRFAKHEIALQVICSNTPGWHDCDCLRIGLIARLIILATCRRVGAQIESRACTCQIPCSQSQL